MILRCIVAATTLYLGSAQRCPIDNQVVDGTTITWLETAVSSYSRPHCIGYDMRPVLRRCRSGKWEDPPKCKYVQDKEMPFCPDKFTYLKDKNIVCYTILPAAPFPNACPYPNEESFFDYKTKIGINTPLWLPVLRDDEGFGVGDYHINERSRYFGRTATFPDKHVDNVTTKLCMALIGGIETIVDCHEKYFRACVYSVASTDPLNCNANLDEDYDICVAVFSGFTRRCVCKMQGAKPGRKGYKPFEPRRPYENQVNRMISQQGQLCGIGIENGNGDNLVWSSDKAPINYTYWASVVDFEGNDVVMGKVGWEMRPKTTINCHLHAFTFNYGEPKMELALRTANTLVLTIKGFSNLKVLDIIDKIGQIVAMCFFGTETKTPINKFASSYVDRDKDVATITFQALETGPGFYWCQGFRFPDLETAKSNVLFFDDEKLFGGEYALKASIEYESEHNPLHPKIYENFMADLLAELGEEHLPHSLRRMGVLRVNEENATVQYLLHLTISAAQETRDPLEESTEWEDRLRAALYNICGSLDDFSSSRVCLSGETPLGNVTLHWPSLSIGLSTLPQKACVGEGGRLITRRCGGDFLHGGRWSEVTGECSYETPKSSVTQELNTLLEEDLPTEHIVEALVNITGNFDGFEEVDIHLVGKIIGKIAADYDVDAGKVTTVVSNVMDIDRAVLADSQNLLNATDAILKNYDLLLVNAHILRNDSHVVVVSSNLISIVVDLKRVNIAGLALFVNSGEIAVVTLDPTVNMGEVVKKEGFEAALWLDKGLLEQMLQGNEKRHLISTVFKKNTLFNERIPNADRSNAGVIIGVLLPGFGEMFKSPISTFTKTTTRRIPELLCSHWQFAGERHSLWFPSGDVNLMEASNVARCDYRHVTHFGLLVIRNPKNASTTLTTLTAINCAFSYFGLSAIFLTGALFKNWRTNPGNQVLLNFSLAIFFQITLLYGSYFHHQSHPNDYRVCVLLGALLHYSVISEFCWTLVLGFLQFKRLVVVFGGPPRRLLLKSCLIGWVLPLTPVLPLLAFFQDNYTKREDLCYPSNFGLLMTVVLPLFLVLCFNLTVFFKIVREIWRKSSPRSTTNYELAYQWRMIILLFFMMGLTWILGVLTYVDGGRFFIYPFAFLATLQGFMLFLFFVMLNKTTRNLYASLFRRLFRMY